MKLSIKSLLISSLLAFSLSACKEEPKLYNHDKQSADLVEQSLKAMGGMENYKATRYVSWSFFGKRFHVWDKHSGDVRIESGNSVVLMNINTQQGKAWENGVEITDSEALAKKLNQGYKAWINDSYWLVMPYKLQDPGVVLQYVKQGTSEGGKLGDIVALTFEGVGITPDNKYELFFDKESKLITQFAFYKSSTDEQARFTRPWTGWKPYGKTLLADSRGKGSLAPISVFDELPKAVFTSPEKAVDQEGNAIAGRQIN